MGEQDRTVIVTGGSRGMGASHAITLARAGWNVVIADVIGGDGIQQEIASEGHGSEYFHLDVTDPESWKHLAQSLAASGKRINGLVNNAGVSFRKGIQETSNEDWERVMSVNLTGTFYGLREISSLIRDSGGGSIVNISSITGNIGYHAAAYSASKWGVRGLTKTAASEFAPWRIRVNSVHPGLISTPMVDGANAFIASSLESIPAERAGQPEEVSQAVEFLISDASSYMTGSEITVDGGITAGGTYWRINNEAAKNSVGGDL